MISKLPYCAYACKEQILFTTFWRYAIRGLRRNCTFFQLKVIMGNIVGYEIDHSEEF